jgi:hypothetical protein
MLSARDGALKSGRGMIDFKFTNSRVVADNSSTL